ncbi:MAG: hypothetical protein AMS27_00650 [Bacteroides sp. SM23_62_1]|nr:MAG: hypothetical protein AMS27_00650 [Bacteroides sp. SM23_62_1]
MNNEKTEKVDWNAFTVLIVEDDLANYKLLESLFKKTKINILWAKSGIEAIKTCEICNKINIILMDIQLPEMDGFEASKIIKSKHPDIPVIILTASVADGESIRADDFICDRIVSKPFNLNHLINTIKELLPL